MPNYLRKDTIRLLEASVESINLAIIGLGLPRRFELREPTVYNAASIGLIGVSAELAMSAILIQVYGPSALELSNGHFKSGATIIDDFRGLINVPIPRLSFITKGINDPISHLRFIYNHTLRFRILVSMRAGAVHAGWGPSYDVSVISLNEIISFLYTLSLSARIRPYLTYIPSPPTIVKDRTLIIEDIARSLRESGSLVEQARLLSSVFLVLPELPNEQPEWLMAFDRLTVAPREGDITYLLNVLENALPANLMRVAGGGENIPVVVRQNDPNALPISPQYLRREFTQIPDQWFADIANANGRLNQGMLDLPPPDFVLDVYALRIDNINVLPASQILTAHEVWPFIVSSLSVSGTAGPYWFLIRKTNDIGQLKSHIERAVQIGTGYLRNRHREIIAGLDSILNNVSLPITEQFVNDLMTAQDAAEEKRSNLDQIILRGNRSFRELSDRNYAVFEQLNAGNITVGNLLLGITGGEISFTDDRARNYWIRIVAELCTNEEDVPGLLAVLRTAHLTSAHTAARKAIRLIDFLSYGPNINI
jgi:hypothetical protein